ncbi:disease resistance protein RGA2-like [Phoenix dactylifera]|uniref:Disease resistance protein RGA2-like n=1 Tax=Phoenix dactylifera TaxID=42345 RepID=A0A8B9A237_PHODC|nr:disease resistance protein RGA2-like [Phoenix dactylifera]
MGGFTSYRLQRLSDNNCWSLFRNCAFVDGNSSGYPRLEEIGKEIVKKLKGLPLAAKAVGSLLYSKVDEEEWKDILRSEIWELTPDKNSILPALRLSYKHLPPHLKQCFAFCAVFHKDYVFERDNLVQIWMALGFVQPQGSKRLEDIGNTYFDDLLSRSFFQPYKGNYVMHDAIHDLAQYITIDDCHRLEDDKRLNNRNKIRHLSFSCDNSMLTSFEAFYSFKRLRTLLLLRGYKSSITSVPDDLFMKLRYLRVLDLYRRGIKEVPHSIGNLKQLRYLGLSSTEIKTLPSSVSKLYNLQMLKLKNCSSLRELPQGITNLLNLHHLEANTRLIANLAGIGRLTCLQELEEFAVQKDRGYKIAELKDMMQLRGRLCITGLEKVASGEEANEAELNTKEHLSLLEFAWEDSRNIGLHEQCLDERVLEGLRPHRGLKEMKIIGYAGADFPSWLASPLSSLKTIQLSNCIRCLGLPPLGQLPFLKKLEIRGADEVIQISREFSGNGATKGFPSLNELVLDDMPKLEEWLFADGDQLFPRLTELDVIDCPKLKALPRLPSTLTRLRISEAGLGVLPKLWDSKQPSSLSSLHIDNYPNLTSLQQGLLSHPLSALKDLKINNCEGLLSLPLECFRHFTSLESLHICKCPMLVPSTALKDGLLPGSLEDVRVGFCYQLINPLLDELRNLAFLTHLEIANCPDLYYFPLEGLPDTLKFLSILDCANLQHLPPQLWKLSSLVTLIISNCPRIPHLPSEGLPRGLHELYIKACPSLKETCELGREDWAKVAHIAKVEIDEDIMSE